MDGEIEKLLLELARVRVLMHDFISSRYVIQHVMRKQSDEFPETMWLSDFIRKMTEKIAAIAKIEEEVGPLTNTAAREEALQWLIFLEEQFGKDNCEITTLTQVVDECERRAKECIKRGLEIIEELKRPD